MVIITILFKGYNTFGGGLKTPKKTDVLISFYWSRTLKSLTSHVQGMEGILPLLNDMITN